MRLLKLGIILIVMIVAAQAKTPKMPKFKPAKAQTYKTPKYKNSDHQPSVRNVPKHEADKTAFRKENPCPSTGKVKGDCPGYVLDHSINIPDDGSAASVFIAWRPKEGGQD